jgi:hypothetical protein
MKRAIGWILLLAGIGVVCVGVYLALSPVIATYQSAMDDPLKDSPIAQQEGAPGGDQQEGKALAKKMLTGVAVGALGLPLTVAGTVLLGISFVQRMRKRFEKEAGRGMA